jgi:hypothetical protein
MADTDTSPTPEPTQPAVGTLEDVPAHLRRAFEETGDFDPLPPPRPHDWLAQHPEPGQTFDQFLRAPHHRPDARRHRLYFLPLGDFPPGRSPSLDRLRAFTCLINGSNDLAESDARPLHLCPVDLRKLQHSVGFDPVARYRQLLELSRNAGFDDEARWLARRLRHIERTPE